ncbi:MAG: 4'-phosphopantetheinyl transferase superfamily protein [Leptolyngbya sp. SIOISBB]|nr:4'-phosphopantetheinyl transferase superfamily protein [Leptolyngbya sp. SIOISBB]
MLPQLQNITLEPDEVHIWLTFSEDCHAAEMHSEYVNWLDSQEENRYRTFKFQRHRFDFLCAHALSRSCLASYCQVHPTDIKFSHNQYGRPELQHPKCSPIIHFSLSHTNGIAVFAAAHLENIGIDIENTQRQLDYLQIANTSFSVSEIQEIESLSDQVLKDRFFQYWTLKEAYTKALGMGLSFPFNQCIFHISPDSEESISFFDRTAKNTDLDWQFALLQPLEHLCIALAVHSSRNLKVRTMKVIPGFSNDPIRTKILFKHMKTISS